MQHTGAVVAGAANDELPHSFDARSRELFEAWLFLVDCFGAKRTGVRRFDFCDRNRGVVVDHGSNEVISASTDCGEQFDPLAVGAGEIRIEVTDVRMRNLQADGELSDDEVFLDFDF